MKPLIIDIDVDKSADFLSRECKQRFNDQSFEHVKLTGFKFNSVVACSIDTNIQYENIRCYYILVTRLVLNWLISISSFYKSKSSKWG